MTFLAEHLAPDFRLKRHAVVFSAMVADDFKPGRRVFARRGFFRPAYGAALRRRHVSLIKKLLLFFRKKKNFLALNARNFQVGHYLSPPTSGVINYSAASVTQNARI